MGDCQKETTVLPAPVYAMYIETLVGRERETTPTFSVAVRDSELKLFGISLKRRVYKDIATITTKFYIIISLLFSISLENRII